MGVSVLRRIECLTEGGGSIPAVLRGLLHELIAKPFDLAHRKRLAAAILADACRQPGQGYFHFAR